LAWCFTQFLPALILETNAVEMTLRSTYHQRNQHRYCFVTPKAW